MNFPTFDTPITVFSRNTCTENGKTLTKWTRNTVDNCFFGYERRQVISGNAVSASDKFTVRIPKAKSDLKKGDIVVGKLVYDQIPDNKSGAEILDKYKGAAFMVNTVRDNSRSGLPFPHIRGSEA